MLNIRNVLFALLMSVISTSCNANDKPKSTTTSSSNQLQWLTNYEDAVTKSQATSKPIVLFFTGSDWCSWCTKLEEEALNTPDFIQDAGNNYIFVKVDFPQAKPLDSKTASQNSNLKSRFNIKGFPTLIILDDHQQQIGESGYRAGGGKKYAEHLKKMVEDSSSYRNKMNNVSSNHSSFTDLKALFEKADEINSDADMQQLIKLGLQLDQDNFFLLEQYRAMVDEGLIHSPEALSIREKIISGDPQNNKNTQFALAIIDFEGYANDMNAQNMAPETALEPLLSYIQKFGAQDKDNLWKVHMLVAQVYVDKGNIAEALMHAELALNAAPSDRHSDIQKAITSIKSIDSKK